LRQKNEGNTTDQSKAAKTGMTLTETIVGVALLVLVFAGALKAYSTSMALYSSSQDEGVMTQLAASRFERLEMVEYDNLPLWSTTEMVVNEYGHPSAQGRFRISTAVTVSSSGTETDIKTSVARRTKTSSAFSKAKTFSIIRYKEAH
jgi:Tfp pilus assembly protein PilW